MGKMIFSEAQGQVSFILSWACKHYEYLNLQLCTSRIRLRLGKDFKLYANGQEMLTAKM